jgi:hypothetical protein
MLRYIVHYFLEIFRLWFKNEPKNPGWGPRIHVKGPRWCDYGPGPTAWLAFVGMIWTGGVVLIMAMTPSDQSGNQIEHEHHNVTTPMSSLITVYMVGG